MDSPIIFKSPHDDGFNASLKYIKHSKGMDSYVDKEAAHLYTYSQFTFLFLGPRPSKLSHILKKIE